MPAIVLLALKLGFLALLYLFLYRAVRAIVLDVFGPRAPRRKRTGTQHAVHRAPKQAPAKAPRKLPRELLIADSDGKRRVPLTDSITVGRAATCDVALSDTYVSNVHARLFTRDGSYWVEDLGSTNGTYLNQSKVSAPTAIGPGDELRLGKAVLELRR